jgi:hypothetical protein
MPESRPVHEDVQVFRGADDRSDGSKDSLRESVLLSN